MKQYLNLKSKEVNEALFEACKNNDLPSVRFLVENYPNCDFSANKSLLEENCIKILCKNNSIDIVKYLVEQGNKKHIFVSNQNRSKIKEFIFEVMYYLGQSGHIELLDYFVKAYKDDLTLQGIKESLSTCLRGSSGVGNVEFCRYLLLSKNLPVHPSLSENNYYPYQLAAQEGHLDLIKFYLLSHELKNRPKVGNYKDMSVRSAGWRNHFHVIEYLLTSAELPEHADIHSTGESLLEAAVRNENVEMIKFLLTSPKLKEHADLHYKNDLIFRNAVKKNKMTSLQYLICDYEIPLNENIQKAIKKRLDIQKMFEMRSLYKKLNNKLVAKQTKTKTEKI